MTTQRYNCKKCGKTFKPNKEPKNCLVMHLEGTCCHFNDTEVPSQPPDPLDEIMDRSLKNDRFIPDLKCPACNWKSIFVASGNYLTCSQYDCPNPDYTDALAKSMLSRKAVEEALNKGFNTEHTMDDWKAGYNQAILDIRTALGMEK